MRPIKTIPLESVDGIGSDLRVICAEQTSPAVLICLPAMGVKAERYDAFAQALCEAGFSVVIGELRGIGSSSVRASRSHDFGYNDLVVNDVSAIHSKVVELFPEQDIYFCGHSLGGQLAALFLSQKPTAAKGLVLCASCTVYHRGWEFPHNLGILLSSQLFAIVASLLGYFPGYKLGFGGREAKTVIHDWAKNAKTGRYELRGSLKDYESDMQAVAVPLLAINFSDDNFAPIMATKNLIAKLASCDSTHIEISGSQMGQKTANHFNWTRSPDCIAKSIANWINS